MIREGNRRNDGCPDESVSCKHGALHRDCERTTARRRTVERPPRPTGRSSPPVDCGAFTAASILALGDERGLR